MSLKEKQKEAIYYTVFPISGRDIYVRCAPYGVWKVAYIYIYIYAMLPLIFYKVC